MITSNEIKAIGKFQKTHALKGELNAILDIDPEYVTDGNAIVVDIDGIFVPFFASSIRPKGATSYLIKLDGIDSEEDARQFVNKIIYGIKNELASFLEIDEEDIMDEDELEGYEIIDDQTNESIGKIESIDSSTENLLFVVETNEGETVYIPAVDDFIIEVDDNEKIIRMNLPAGLVDLNK